MTLGSPYNLSLSEFSIKSQESGIHWQQGTSYIFCSCDKTLWWLISDRRMFSIDLVSRVLSGIQQRRIIEEDSGWSVWVKKVGSARDLEDVPTPSLQRLLLDPWYLRQSPPLRTAQKYLPAVSCDYQYPTSLERAIYFRSFEAAHNPARRTRSCVFETIRATVGLPAFPSTVFYILHCTGGEGTCRGAM